VARPIKLGIYNKEYACSITAKSCDERTLEAVERLLAFQVAARRDGFVEVNEVDDGSAVWFRNARPDVETNVHKRLCIDGITNSATIYWETVGAKLNSKTFRTVLSLQEWLGLHPAQ
jgi:hypothetical protein